MKIFINCALAYFCGFGFGFLLGFYDFAGSIYFDCASAIRAGALFACAFSITALYEQLFKQN